VNGAGALRATETGQCDMEGTSGIMGRRVYFLERLERLERFLGL
jgi:hypothetical protein